MPAYSGGKSAADRRYLEKNRAKIRAMKKLQRKRTPDRDRAWTWVENALARGAISRQPCEVCGTPKAEAHHEDYTKPSVIQWLCLNHHRERHQHLSSLRAIDHISK